MTRHADFALRVLQHYQQSLALLEPQNRNRLVQGQPQMGVRQNSSPFIDTDLWNLWSFEFGSDMPPHMEATFSDPDL